MSLNSLDNKNSNYSLAEIGNGDSDRSQSSNNKETKRGSYSLMDMVPVDSDKIKSFFINNPNVDSSHKLIREIICVIDPKFEEKTRIGYGAIQLNAIKTKVDDIIDESKE